MQSYPSIPTAAGYDRTLSYHVFDKRDGSNVRAEWTSKKGLVKFGSRTQLLSAEQKVLFPAIEIIRRHEHDLDAALRQTGLAKATLFFEYEGPNSFAGSHTDDVALMGVRLLDVHAFGRGLMEPAWVRALGMDAHVPMAELLHVGRVDEQMLLDIRAGVFPGVTAEGVVAKGPFVRALGHPVMFKHKTQAWFDRLRAHVGGDERLFKMLA